MNRLTCCVVPLLVVVITPCAALAQGGLEKVRVDERMVSASSAYASYTAARAFDGDLSQNSGWCAAGGQKQAWLAVDFGRPHALRRVRVFPDRWDAEHNRGDSFLDRFRVEVREGQAWKAVGGPVSTPKETWYEVQVDGSVSAVRIVAESDGNSPQIKEIELLEAPAPAAKLKVTESMLSASSVYASYTPMRAFDGDLGQNTGWCASGGQKQAWLVVDFGRAQSVKRVRVFPDRWDAAHNPGDSFLDRFRVEQWDGTAWKPASPLTATPQEIWYEVPVNATTSKLRIWAESNGNSPQIKELELYE